jgi:hypothetical protein
MENPPEQLPPGSSTSQAFVGEVFPCQKLWHLFRCYGIFHAVSMEPGVAEPTVHHRHHYGGSPYPCRLNAKNPILVTPVSENHVGKNSSSAYLQ